MVSDLDELMPRVSTHFVIVQGDQTLLEALALLKQQGGQEWWFLVVEVWDDDQPTYLGARFGDFRDRINAERPSILEAPLKDLGDPLVPVEIISQRDKLSRARQLAQDNLRGLVLVCAEAGPSRAALEMRRTSIVGVISIGVARSGADFDGPSLFDLAGLVEARASKPPTRRRPGLEDGVARSEVEPSLPAVAPSQALAPSARAEPAAPPMDREGEIEASQPQPTETFAGAAQGEQSLDVGIGGNVSGRVDVAGRDIQKTEIGRVEGDYVAGDKVIVLPPEKQTRQQERRFEAAFPHEVHVGAEYDLSVAVLLPDAPSPFTEEKRAKLLESEVMRAAVEFEVDAKTGQLKPASVEVAVTGKGFKVIGDSKKVLTVRPDGLMDMRTFVLQAEREGKPQIMVEIMQEGRLLKQMTIEARAYTKKAKPAHKLNLTLQIAAFTVSFSFAAGAAA